MAERIKRRPVGFRVGGALVAAGILPYLVMLHGLLTGQGVHADPAMLAKFAAVSAGLIASGLTIWAIGWSIAARD
jgi:hypothetical protein